jgi:deoxyribodipyrimidine photo-lyase
MAATDQKPAQQNSGALQIVWFKRDLRVADHAPLVNAANHGPVLPLYVVEPDYWRQPDLSLRHWYFLQESLQDLSDALSRLGCPLYVTSGCVLEVLSKINQRVAVDNIWSHEETGNLWTFNRDKRVAKWCGSNHVEWTELPQHGVIRRLGDRSGWSKRWDKLMRSAVYDIPSQLKPAAINTKITTDIPALPYPGFDADCTTTKATQRGGRTEALKLLQSFLNKRGERYQKEMSSPVTAEHSCSRLSAHLALGCVSMREVFQAVENRQKAVRAMTAEQRGMWGRSLNSYAGRLHWHCHFIQKLEDQPMHELHNVHRAFDGMREVQFDSEKFHAWCAGQTGFSFVDACMRYLNATGWINFRMRAMLMSFAAYQLFLHWREPGLYLARAFTDYEPGIHWNQVQMQSGTTGINTVRIYNPVKQSHDQDPDGGFIRQWVPELQSVPDNFVHEPWTMDASMQRESNCVIGCDYPSPVVDHMAAARYAREHIYAVRRGEGFREAAEQIQQKHGSRKSGVPRSDRPAKSRTIPPQLTLDL